MDRIQTGIEGLDEVLGGGIPIGSLFILSGAPGSGKTILAQQMCFANATEERRALYYSTLSEPTGKLVRHLEPFAFFDENKLERSVEFIALPDLIRKHGLRAGLDEIVRASFSTPASVIVVDSAKALRDLPEAGESFREIVYDLASRVAHSDAVLVFVGEYGLEDQTHAPEFAVADGIVHLAVEPTGLAERRTLRVLKMRGSEQLSGVHTARVGPEGIRVYPRIESRPSKRAAPTPERDLTGIASLDAMLGGGLPRGSATLVVGPSGVGKTVLGLHFLAEGLRRGERCLALTFQESEEQLLARAASFGWDLRSARDAGSLDMHYFQPIELGVDVVASRLEEALRAGGGARRVLIDSLAELQHATSGSNRFADFIWAIAEQCRSVGASSLMTSETEVFFGPAVELARGISFVVDNVILLRYAEVASEMRRLLGVIKMRDSDHTKTLVEYAIGSKGVDVYGKLAGLTGVLTGTPVGTEEKFREFFEKPRRK